MTQVALPTYQVALRTLAVAGFTIEGSHRQPRHIEIRCSKSDILGARVLYLFACTNEDEFTPREVEEVRNSARRQGRILLAVAQSYSEHWIAWDDFIEAFGGAVPSWQALSANFDEALDAASRNTLPEGMSGEAWLIFEDLVASGLEFTFGRQVRRLGGRKRGRTVSDMQAQLPTREVLVVDSKATGSSFDAGWSNLRALSEYVERQRVRQRGQADVYSALVVSSAFTQDSTKLAQTSRRFFAEARVPVTFMTAEHLREAVNSLKDMPYVRNAIQWAPLLSGGLFDIAAFRAEFGSAQDEQIRRDM